MKVKEESEKVGLKLNIQKMKIMASGPNFMANRWENSGNSGWLYFGGLQNHCRWWLQPWNKKTLLPGRKVMTNLDSILKSKDITLPTKVRLVKAMYGCESWTVKKAEHQRIDAFVPWCWRRLLRVTWPARRSNQSILKEISPECSSGLMLKLKRQYLPTWCKELIHVKRPWCWERLKAGGEGMRWLDGITNSMDMS